MQNAKYNPTKKQQRRERSSPVANGTRFPLAFRKITNIKIWGIAWLIATLICIIAAPFGSDIFSLPIRAIYWASWNAYSAISMWVILTMSYKLNIKSEIMRSLLCSAIFATFYVLFWQLVSRPIAAYFEASFIEKWRNCFLIALAIFAIVHLALGKKQATKKPTKLYTRLSKYPNAQILAIKAQDHYVEIITNQGPELIRMRFKDAISETQGLSGLQIHRSYWVAKNAIQKIEKSKNEIELTNGASIPISKRRLQTLYAVIHQNETLTKRT